jgi:predicted small secreted protein
MNNRRKRVLILLCLITVVLAATTLTRCGKGVGEGFDASAAGMKF